MPPPNSNGPGLSPDQLEKMSVFVEMLGEGIAQNWWKKGYWARFADVILQRSHQKGMATPGTAPRVSPAVPCEVSRYSEDGEAKVETTTVAELLAEIADSQLDLLDSLEDLTDALRQGKKSKLKRRRPKR
jgi:hypothetical protein